MEKETIKGYKGFDKDLKCRGFQYEVGKEYSTDKAVACNTGFHYCENPMDVLGFYAPCDDTGNPNRFCEVEGSGDFDTSKDDKLCCTWKSHATLTLLAKQDCPLWLQYD